MIKRLLTLILALHFTLPAMADEGMWLLMLLGKNYAEMKKMGFRLTPEDIYSVNKASMKDAVVQLRNNGRGFCTGEVISKEGLILTNHHCAYDMIQSHSSPEKDYLSNGFWAMSRDQELQNPGMEVAFLVRMEDITPKVLAELNDQMSEADRRKKMNEMLQKIAADYKQAEKAKGNDYDVRALDLFGGNQFFVFIYEVYKDLRLVGAPPESIGKFGGDTDNWEWPRHTGDFSLLRVYAKPDGKPSTGYDATNVPLKPRHHFPVSLNGVREGDFTMVFGFPGRTDRYLVSYGVKQVIETINPARVRMRDKRLALWKEDMDASKDIRIKYASNYASIANYWKYFRGEAMILKRLNVEQQKRDQEAAFQKWAEADATRKAKYGNVLTELEQAYNTRAKYIIPREYANEALFAPEVITFAAQFSGLANALEKGGEADVKKMAEGMMSALDNMYKDYNAPTDQKVMAALYGMYLRDVPAEFHPAYLKTNNNAAALTDMVFKNSIFVSRAKLEEFLKAPKLETLKTDPAYQIYQSAREAVLALPTDFQTALDRNNRLYIAGLMEMNPNKNFYPNANSTPRLTYGKVGGYKSKDATIYAFETTLEGIMQKEDPSNPEFVVPAKLKELYQRKDYGRYGANGTLTVAFISNNDITGGNSGSPVINGEGHIVGCAFDGNWDAMSGNIAFEPNLQRCINVDIRYVLFIIDKFAGAGHLVNEMTLVEGKNAPKSGKGGSK